MLLLCSNKVGRAVGGEAGDELLGGVVGDRTSRLGVHFHNQAEIVELAVLL